MLRSRDAARIVMRTVEDEMTGMVVWIVLGLVTWVVGVAFVFVLCQVAGNQDRAACRAEKTLPAHP